MSDTDPGPRSVLADDPSAKLFDREQSLTIAQQVTGFMAAPRGSVFVGSSGWGETEFALNEVLGGYDNSDSRVYFLEQFDRREVFMGTDEVDDAALKTAVTKAEALANALTVLGPPRGEEDPLRPVSPVNPLLWSDKSLEVLAPESRLAPIETSLAAVQNAGLIGKGYLRSQPDTQAVLTKDGHYEYGRRSICGFSISARTKDGTGSGWAAWEGEDWSKANVDALTAQAIDLAERSMNPVAVEPGRYTVVLTPDAVGAFFHWISFTRSDGGGNELGRQVLDTRVSISSDPMDPLGGFLPFVYAQGLVQYIPVTWIDHGIQKVLAYYTRAAAAEHGLDQVNDPHVYRMSGGTTSIEEMIAQTQRGIYVTRFSNVVPVSSKGLLTGVTRDGTFLIEHGKITKPIKNMRFEDSPFFFLNNLTALGPARRVQGGHVVPPVMARDFAFTSLTDAI